VRLARVVGNLVATVKHPAFAGHKLMLCQPIKEDRSDDGDVLIIAVDRAQSGAGDTVLINQEGNGSRQLIGTIDGKLPIRSVIVGVVDQLDVS
jgi:ethanolamine utilization protein EutN